MPLRRVHQNILQLTGGPNAADDPFVSVYHEQQHFGYRDQAGNIWDAWYDGHGNWNRQRLNGGGDARTDGPPAVAGPFIGVFHDQQHFAYLDQAGVIWDAWYDGNGNWNKQQINGGPYGAPLAWYRPDAPPPFVSIWTDPSNTQQHFTYLSIDRTIRDVFWDSDPPLRQPYWNRQMLAYDRDVSSSPFGCIFHDQQHIGYLSGYGYIYDTWYDGNGHWNRQQINEGGGRTKGPQAFLGKHPFIWVDKTNTQQHFTYLGIDRAIYDAFWDSDYNSWGLLKINLGGLTDGPAAWSTPHVCFWEPSGKQYFVYRDEIGHIWFPTFDTDTDNWELGSLERSWPDVTGEVLASGGVFALVDHTGSQLHLTWRKNESPFVSPPGLRSKLACLM